MEDQQNFQIATNILFIGSIFFAIGSYFLSSFEGININLAKWICLFSLIILVSGLLFLFGTVVYEKKYRNNVVLFAIIIFWGGILGLMFCIIFLFIQLWAINPSL
jgi:uncharacterized membrane protein YoaT (DUF817 family)